jgi:hypothetical protein
VRAYPARIPNPLVRQAPTTSRTVTESPISSASAFRTHAFTGTMERLSTPRQRLGADLTDLAAERALPGWAGPLAGDDATAPRGLGHAMRDYYAAPLAPRWGVIGGSVDADRSRRARALTDGGVERLVVTLHPTIRWNAPVLEAAYPYE